MNGGSQLISLSEVEFHLIVPLAELVLSLSGWQVEAYKIWLNKEVPCALAIKCKNPRVEVTIIK